VKAAGARGERRRVSGGRRRIGCRQPAEAAREIGHDVNDDALVLDAAGAGEERRPHQSSAEALEDVGPDDEIGDSGLEASQPKMVSKHKNRASLLQGPGTFRRSAELRNSVDLRNDSVPLAAEAAQIAYPQLDPFADLSGARNSPHCSAHRVGRLG